eukprot:9501895-Pyramimonas_sp.AAC.1
MPCTRGYPWQYVNEAMYYRSVSEKALKKLKGHVTLFRKLLWVARDLAQEVMKIKGQICLEWPTPCRCWSDPHVKEFRNKYNMTRIWLHGCAYGLKRSKGQCTTKSW